MSTSKRLRAMLRFIGVLLVLAFLFCGPGLILGYVQASGQNQTAISKEALVDLPGNQPMVDFLSRTVQELKTGEGAGLPELPQIGTFNGWSLWMGWEGSFSDTYVPQNEAYDWVVYFAPEGIYLALQNSKSVYSGVNVYASIGSFFGALVSPDGNIVTRSYINSLYAASITINITPCSFVPVGPLAMGSLSMSVGAGPTFFKCGSNATILERAIQYSTSATAAFDLIPITVPGTVSLAYESTFSHGFYPLVQWNLDPSNPNPFNTIVAGLQTLASQGNTLAQKIIREMAKMVLPFMSKLQTSGPVTLQNDVKPISPAQYFGHFLQNNSLTVPPNSPNTSIDYLITKAQQWLQNGWVDQPIFSQVNIPINLTELRDIMKPIKPSTDLAFEAGYQLVYDTSTTMVSENCLNEVQATPCKPCTLTVTANEIAALVPGSSPQDFEGVDVIFTNSPEAFLSSGYATTAVTIENGVAAYEFVQYSASPFVVSAQVNAIAATGNKKLQMCRWVISFDQAKGWLSAVLDLLAE